MTTFLTEISLLIEVISQLKKLNPIFLAGDDKSFSTLYLNIEVFKKTSTS